MWRVVVASAIAALVLAAAAVATITQTYTQTFSNSHPGQSSGMNFQAWGSPQAKTVTLTFPPGTVINTKALAACGNTARTCPARSKVGTGSAVIRLGTLSMTLPVAAYNRAGA